MLELKEALEKATKDLFGLDIEAELTRTDEQFGDYATNAALKIGAKSRKNPKQIAVALAGKLHGTPGIKDVSVAGPGFINVRLTDEKLADMAFAKIEPPKKLAGKSIVIEYSDPNPFKVLHVGHLYTSIVGDAVAKLFEVHGADVHRVNFGGDVGLHVAKTMWAIIQRLGGENPKKLKDIPKDKRADWLSEEYVAGSFAYGEEEKFQSEGKVEINRLNKRIYEIQEKNDHDSPLAKIYWTCRQWSYDHFEEFYKKIGSGFEKYYPESLTFSPGLKVVKENIGGVFEQSEGAVVFKGEVHNMHTRVFITSKGLPTYETKDIGLTILKWQDYHFDRSIIITGNEQVDYMQVVLKAVEQIEPKLSKRTTHITHGMVRLSGSPKMSSRRGNIVTANSVIEMAERANDKINKRKDTSVALGAIKYAFLKQRIGADLIYDPAESVSLEGNSGPYLQYAHARARSILQKAGPAASHKINDLEAEERSLAVKISEYPEVVEAAAEELLPSHICTYLYELAQSFNKFYEKNRVIGNDRESIRLKLVEGYADVLKNGLDLLNISAPYQM